MKSNTQNAKIESITDKTMVIGIDIGSETHYARAFTNRGIELSDKPFSFSNTESGFQEFKAWMEDLMKKNGMEAVAPGMEPTGHYWFNLGAFLQDSGIQPLHVNPYHVKQSKELDDNNPTKNDRKDPKVIAGLVNAGRYSKPYIPRDVYAEVRCLSNQRLQAQENLTRAKKPACQMVQHLFSGIQRRLQYSGCRQRNYDSEESTASGRYHRSWR